MTYPPDGEDPGPGAPRQPARSGSSGAADTGGHATSGAGRPPVVGGTDPSGWKAVSRRYRRGLGGWWWVALVAVPLLLAALGTALGGDDPAPTADPAPSASAGTALGGVARYSVSRSGDSATVTATVRDEAAKQALLVQVRSSVRPSTRVVDAVTVTLGSPVLDPAAVAAVTAGLADAAAYRIDYDNGVLTLTGTVASATAKTAAGDQAQRSYPQATIRNELTVGTLTAAPAAPTTAATSAPTGPTDCAKIAETVSGLLAQTRILFVTNGDRLTPESQAQLERLATAVGGCRGTRLLVAGNTDSVGDEARNRVLSLSRAQSVKGQLVQYGVPAGDVEAVGNGSTKPVAENATEAGRQANRRVDITVR